MTGTELASPRLYLNHVSGLDWLIALEFGRVDDGQPSDHTPPAMPAPKTSSHSQQPSPEKLAPIHTDGPERYTQLVPRVDAHRDGEWWTP